MELAGKVIVVTGAASGIGRALARRFATEARGVAVADIDGDGAAKVTAEINESGGSAIAVATDVAVEADVEHLVERAEEEYGPIDLFCSNAGIGVGGGVDTADEDWDRIWRVNVMAHVFAARAVLPGMLARGDGYLLQTVSAAGLLTNIGAAPYSVTKHGALALAEWLAVTHGDAGIKVSCLCPQGVRTNLLMGGQDRPAGSVVSKVANVLEPEEVAEVVVQGLRDERFLILPHPEVAEYFRRKADDYDRWLAGMRRLQARVAAAAA